jgi:hypothetical protein
MMFPKSKREENAHYRSMAERMPCQMRVPGVCNHNPETVVLAHSNQAKHNKGGALKAHDWAGVWACYACHTWLDQGKAGAQEKHDAFDLGLKRMERELEKIVANIMAKPRDREAAWWALERIRASVAAD